MYKVFKTRHLLSERTRRIYSYILSQSLICLQMARGSTTVRTQTAGKHYLMVLHYTPYSLSRTNNHT